MNLKKNKLTLEDKFSFICDRSLNCYTSCCRDVNIFLTPNDVLRLKKIMGISSTEFLKVYTDLIVIKDRHLPLIQLKMNEKENKKCFFVRSHGCLYYSHRPWACRMFPLDERPSGGFNIIADPKKCHGLKHGRTWQIKEWLKSQGAIQSKEADGSYDALTGHHLLKKLDISNDQILQMVVTALWDIDKFREMVLNSSFLKKFEIEEERINAIKRDDIAMMDLGFDWVRFGILGQKTLKIKQQK